MRTTHNCLYASKVTKARYYETGYWYIVTDGAMTHTAFVTRGGLDRWLDERGLKLACELPTGEHDHGFCTVVGSYRTESHLHDADKFGELLGFSTRALSNGDYVVAVVTDDADGLRTVHTLNPNVRDRHVFDYTESRLLMS